MNMDMVRAAGFDETLRRRLGHLRRLRHEDDEGDGDLRSRHRHAARRLRRVVPARARRRRQYLTRDLSAPAINTPRVVQATQQLVGFLRAGDRAAAGDLRLQHGAGCLHRRPAGDLLVRPDHRAVLGPNPAAAFEWAVLPYPPGPQTRVNFNDIGFYAMSSQDAEQGSRLGGPEVVDERRAGRLLDGVLGHLSGPRRRRGAWATARTARRSSPPRSTLPEVQRRARAVRGVGDDRGRRRRRRSPGLRRRDHGRGSGREHRADRAAGGLRLTRGATTARGRRSTRAAASRPDAPVSAVVTRGDDPGAGRRDWRVRRSAADAPDRGGAPPAGAPRRLQARADRLGVPGADVRLLRRLPAGAGGPRLLVEHPGRRAHHRLGVRRARQLPPAAEPASTPRSPSATPCASR